MGRAAVGAGSPVVMGSMNSPMLVCAHTQHGVSSSVLLQASQHRVLCPAVGKPRVPFSDIWLPAA